MARLKKGPSFSFFAVFLRAFIILIYFVSFQKGEDNAAFLKLSGPQHILSPGFFFFSFFEKRNIKLGTSFGSWCFIFLLTHRLVHNEFVQIF